jgi:gliding motility-associated-like protein
VKYTFFLLVLFCIERASACGPGTPSFTVNLVGQPNGTYTSPAVVRNDTCCGALAPDVCIKFTIFLDPNAIGINFQIASGAVPPGALFYQINCGPPIAVGSPICLNGPGPHILTFCKPGNNQNSFAITSIPGPVVPDSVTVRNGCSATLAVTGFSVPTITWNSINPAPPGAYNSYLNCVSGCASVIVTPTGTPPAFVDYLVTGSVQAPCQANTYQDTVRVYFYSDLLAGINPSMTTLCFGQTNALLTATVTGGLPPYTYTWSNGSNSPSVNVGPGTYTVIVGDNTNCPPTTATAVVNSFSLPITANAGPDQNLCKTSPNAVFQGTIGMASGGIWSGGTGTFSPSNTALTMTYIPTLAEVTTGSVQLTLTSTGNQGCPGASDNVILFFQNPPVANAGSSMSVCANNNLVSLTGSITGYSSTPQWLSSGSGVFTSTSNLTTTYTPSNADITAGSVIFTLTTQNNGACPPSTSTVQIAITPAPVVNAGASQTICSNATAALSGSVTGPTNSGSWSTGGDGAFNPSPNLLNTNYIPGPNDINNGSVTLTLTSTGNGNCIAVTSTVIIGIKKIAIVNVSPSQTICSNAGSINITGTVSGGTSTGLWTTSGSGAFNPGPGSLSTSYNITPSDITAGTVSFTLTSTNNGPCPAITNTLSVSIYQLAQVNAGVNQALCETNSVIALSGTVNTGNGVWSSSGVGSYNPNNISLSTTYSFTPIDISNGFVTFTLSSTNNGPCPIITDSVKITIKKMAIVNVSPSQTICSTASSISLTGTVSGGTSSGIWTTNGSGAFNPGPGALNVAYFITPADIVMGTVIFTLTSTNNAPCAAVNNTLSLSIYQLAQVNAGVNQFLCESTGTVALNGTVNTNNGVWTSNGGGTYNPGNFNLSTTYSFTPADISNGSVTFTLSSVNNGPCPTVSDSVKIAIKKMATVNAGTNQSICSTTGTISLNGIVGGGSSSGIWSTNGNGAFNPGPGALNNTYFVNVSDIGLGTVIFTLTSTNNGPCPAVTDTAALYIYQLAQVNAGLNQALCETAGTVALNGFVNTGNGMWSGGTGTYTPDNLTLNPTYSIGVADINAGFVNFMLSSTNNGPCPVVKDTVKISIRKLAVVNAGGDKAVCSTTNTVFLSGNVSIGSNTGAWSGNGSGSFSPNNTNLNTTYNISGADMTAGSVTLVLTSLNNGVCPAVTDTTVIKIYKNPSIRLSQDTTVCTYQNPLKITPNVSGDYGTLQWNTSGSGVFMPSNISNPITYDFTHDIPSVVVTLSISALNNGPCANVNASIKVTIRPSPTAQFSPSTYTANIPNDPVTFTNHSFQANTYQWNFGDGSTSGAVNPVHNYETVGYYNITLVAINQFGCSDTAHDQIKVVSDIQYPNAFTPNTHGGNGGSFRTDDYSNDVFFPYTAYEGVTGYDLQIFNRWGELIFESKNVLQGWDGYFKGKLCQQDVYVWKAKVEFFDGRLYSKTGSVTLLR